MTLIWSLSSKKLFTSNYKLLDTKKQISHVFLPINIQIEYSGDLNILISWKDIKNCQTYNFYHTKNYTTSSSNEIRFETDFTKKQSAAVGKKKKKNFAPLIIVFYAKDRLANGRFIVSNAPKPDGHCWKVVEKLLSDLTRTI